MEHQGDSQAALTPHYTQLEGAGAHSSGGDPRTHEVTCQDMDTRKAELPKGPEVPAHQWAGMGCCSQEEFSHSLQYKQE